MSNVLLLLVEDEALLQMVLEEALTEAGFDFVMASTGQQALQELNSDAARFQGVLTDIRLGEGPNGWDIGHRARELVPNIPVIYMSGDSAFEWTSKGVPNSIMIKKPFVLAQIITAISQLINDNSTSGMA